MTRKNEPWPEMPGEAEALAQERAAMRELDEIDALITPPTTDLEQLALEEADAVEQRWRRRHGLPPTTETRAGFRSSAELREIGEARGWDHESRSAYLAAYEREDAVRKANRSSYRGGAA